MSLIETYLLKEFNGPGVQKREKEALDVYDQIDDYLADEVFSRRVRQRIMDMVLYYGQKTADIVQEKIAEDNDRAIKESWKASGDFIKAVLEMPKDVPLVISKTDKEPA